MILYIQTNLPDQIRIGWSSQRHITWRTQSTGRAQKLLNLLARHRRPKAIVVVRGPGRFSSVRTGLIVANTLAQEWSVPVAGIVTQKPLTSAVIQRQFFFQRNLVKPWYGQAPNITRSKRTA